MVLFDEACDRVLERFKLKNLKYLQRKGTPMMFLLLIVDHHVQKMYIYII